MKKKNAAIFLAVLILLASLCGCGVESAVE